MRIWGSVGLLVLLAIALTVALTGRPREPGAAPATKSAQAVEPAKPFGRCPVTVPRADAPFAAEGFNHGNRSIGVELWPKGRLVAGRLPDGSYFADIARDGSIEAKLGWWRAVEGRLRVEGRRLDRRAPPLRADIPDGYGPTGLQVTGITFPTQGCWKVVGRVGSARLAFVVRVTTTAGASRKPAS